MPCVVLIILVLTVIQFLLLVDEQPQYGQPSVTSPPYIRQRRPHTMFLSFLFYFRITRRLIYVIRPRIHLLITPDTLPSVPQGLYALGQLTAGLSVGASKNRPPPQGNRTEQRCTVICCIHMQRIQSLESALNKCGEFVCALESEASGWQAIAGANLAMDQLEKEYSQTKVAANFIIPAVTSQDAHTNIDCCTNE